MSLQVEKLEHNMAKVTVTVPAAELKEAVVKEYQKQKKNISVPGFRKGKVPLAMVEKMYGKGVFLEDAANSLLSTSWAKAYDECEEEIVSAPKINVVTLAPDQDFVYEAEVALKPDCEVGKYKGVKIAKIDLEVKDEEIDAVIDRERRNNARELTIEDRPVEDKDKVTIDFEGFKDGVPFEGGKGEDYELVIGSHSFIDTFEEQLIGKSIGEECEVNVTFPEGYQAEELAGQPATFKVKIKGYCLFWFIINRDIRRRFIVPILPKFVIPICDESGNTNLIFKSLPCVFLDYASIVCACGLCRLESNRSPG